jgi:hypothetical protein
VSLIIIIMSFRVNENSLLAFTTLTMWFNPDDNVYIEVVAEVVAEVVVLPDKL